MSRVPVTRVLLFVNHFDRAGTETQLVHLANALNRDPSLEIHVGCNRGGPLLQELEVPSERVRSYPLHRFYSPGGVRQIIRLSAWMRRTRFHLIHAQDFYANVMCAAARLLASGPRLIVGRRYDRRSWWAHRVGEWWTYRLADRVLFNSGAVAEAVTGAGAVPEWKAVIIPNGLQLDQFTEYTWKREDASFGSSGIRRIGAVGRLHPNKGHETLVRAVAALSGRWPGLRLTLVGDGECRDSLRHLADRLGIGPRVEFLGVVPDVAPILPSFDVAVLPSHRGEGLPNALLEYMAAGCPIVATTVGGAGEAARHDREGLLIPPADTGHLASAIEALLQSPAKCRALSAAARARAREYAMPRMVAAVRALYADMTGAVKPARRSADAAYPAGAR